jgi:hypothetical protein
MKKLGEILLSLAIVLFLTSLALAEENITDNSTSGLQDPDKIIKGFECLEQKVGTCSTLSVQEMAFTVLATPKDSTFDNCVTALKNKMNNKYNWGNVRDTALAILALDHAGEDTKNSEGWLLNQTRFPTDLVWYIEQDSNTAVQCRIGYGANDYTINIDDDKKIDKNAGTCLTRAQSNFWLKIESTCYDKEFMVECDKDFIATLLYKNKDTPTVYVLEGTESSPAFGSIKLNVNSRCFGSGSCDYEATLWSTIVLLKKGYDVERFIPYLIAMSQTNERYLPDAFIYMATNYEDYASKLISSIKLGNYWVADKTAYNKFYDTSLALISLGSSSSEQLTKSRDWLLFSQGSNGCWQNAIRETAIVLWALEGRSGKAHDGEGGGVTYCSEANFFCIPTIDCPSTDLRGNYFCGSLSETCCATENLKTCSQMLGSICTGDLICTGDERKALDTNNCCLGQCAERPTETECEQNYYTCMTDSCSEFQEQVIGYTCNQGQVCCMSKSGPDPAPSSKWWIWVLIILIILVLAAILFWLYKKGKLGKGKKNEGSNPPTRPGMPPMPPRGVPPRMPPRMILPPKQPAPFVNRAPMRTAPPKFRDMDRRDPEMSETFKKLRDMSS